MGRDQTKQMVDSCLGIVGPHQCHIILVGFRGMYNCIKQYS